MLNLRDENFTLILRMLLLLLLVVLVAVVMLLPSNITVVPTWRIRVVDESGEPARGVMVRQHWRHYSVENYGHEEELQTDENGYVVFPQRTIKTNALSIIFGSLDKFLENGIHASFGADAHIVVLGGERGFNYGGVATYSSFFPMPSEVVVRRRAR